MRSPLALVLLSLSTHMVNGQALELREGDRIAVVGNTFAERMQLFGWFETFLHARHPTHSLIVRNMGWSGDEGPSARAPWASVRGSGISTKRRSTSSSPASA